MSGFLNTSIMTQMTQVMQMGSDVVKSESARAGAHGGDASAAPPAATARRCRTREKRGRGARRRPAPGAPLARPAL
jgi:hypothetical protein